MFLCKHTFALLTDNSHNNMDVFYFILFYERHLVQARLRQPIITLGPCMRMRSDGFDVVNEQAYF